MEIKQATPSEFVEVLFLLREFEKDMNIKGIRHWVNINLSPEQINEDLEKGNIYLVKDSNVAKGMMKLTGDLPAEYDNVKWKSEIVKPLFLKFFIIHPNWQDSNISEKMIEFAEIFAKENNYSGIRLDVVDNYPVAHSFFENKQFTMADSLLSPSQKAAFVCYEKSL
jgi:hypothetical protein